MLPVTLLYSFNLCPILPYINQNLPSIPSLKKIKMLPVTFNSMPLLLSEKYIKVKVTGNINYLIDLTSPLLYYSR